MTMSLLLMILLLEVEVGTDQRIEPAEYWIWFFNPLSNTTNERRCLSVGANAA